MSIEDQQGAENETSGAESGVEPQNQTGQTLLDTIGNQGNAPPPEDHEGNQDEQNADSESEVPEKYDFKPPKVWSLTKRPSIFTPKQPKKPVYPKKRLTSSWAKLPRIWRSNKSKPLKKQAQNGKRLHAQTLNLAATS
ncbi:hypothetical protein RSJ68_02330 [Neisseria sp. DTU_2020_1000833_1_SI_GRL_NUU_006]|nr:hypothetical protein RSJ68_02330 [Neisseria sp. DTU_2020_1000833_1_SI_GRL_NUU_006]